MEKNRKKKREKSFKRFFFSRIVSFVLVGLFIIFNIISFLSEWLIAGTDWRWSLVLRGTTVLFDTILILTWLNKIRHRSTTRLKRKIPNGKKLYILLWVSDTIWILLFIFSFYVLKLLALLKLDKIDKQTFQINFWLGLATAILLGAGLKYLIDYIKKRTKKWVRLNWRKKLNRKILHKDWCFILESEGKAFFLFQN